MPPTISPRIALKEAIRATPKQKREYIKSIREYNIQARKYEEEKKRIEEQNKKALEEYNKQLKARQAAQARQARAARKARMPTKELEEEIPYAPGATTKEIMEAAAKREREKYQAPTAFERPVIVNDEFYESPAMQRKGITRAYRKKKETELKAPVMLDVPQFTLAKPDSLKIKSDKMVDVSKAKFFTKNPFTRSLGELYTKYKTTKESPKWGIIRDIQSKARQSILGISPDKSKTSTFDEIRGVSSIISDAPGVFAGSIAEEGTQYQIRRQTELDKAIKEGKYDFVPGWLNPQLEKRRLSVKDKDISFLKPEKEIKKAESTAYGSAKVAADLASYFIPGTTTPIKAFKAAKITGDILSSESPQEAAISIGTGAALGFGGKGVKEGASILLSKKGIPVVKSIFATTKLAGEKTLPLAMTYLAGKETDKLIKLYGEDRKQAEKERQKLLTSFAGFSIGQPLGRGIYDKTIGMLTQNPNIVVTKQTIPYREPYNVAKQVLKNKRVNLARATKTPDVKTILYRDPATLQDIGVGKPGAFATIDYPGSKISRVGSYFTEKSTKTTLGEALLSPKSAAIQKLTNVKTADIPKRLQNSILKQLRTKGKVNVKTITEYTKLVQQQANKTKSPIVMLSPKTLTGSPEMENEIFLLFPKIAKGKKPIFKLPQSQLIGVTKKESIPIYETMFDKDIIKSKDLIDTTNIGRQIKFKSNLLDDWAEIVNTKFAQITGKAPRIPTAFEAEKHGTQHYENVLRNIKKLKFKDIKLSADELKLMAQLHDTGKIGSSSFTTWEHGDITAQVLKAGKFKGEQFTKLPQYKKDLIIKAVKTHTTIKPLKFLTSPKADVSDLKGIAQGLFGTPEQKALATADRIDLTRFGIRPDPKQLFLKIGKPSKVSISKPLKVFGKNVVKTTTPKISKTIRSKYQTGKTQWDFKDIPEKQKIISERDKRIFGFGGKDIENRLWKMAPERREAAGFFQTIPKFNKPYIKVKSYPSIYVYGRRTTPIKYSKYIKPKKEKEPYYKPIKKKEYDKSYIKNKEYVTDYVISKKYELARPPYKPDKKYKPPTTPPYYKPPVKSYYDVPPYYKPSKYAYTKYPTYPIYPPTKIPPVIKTPTLLPTLKPKRKDVLKGINRSQAWGVQIYSKGKWKGAKNPKGSMNYIKALNFASGLVDKSSEASFRLKPTNKKAKLISKKISKVSKTKFYQPAKAKRLTSAFVEKNKFRIDSKGEKQKITYKGILASKQKRKLKTKTKKKRGLFNINLF